MADIDKRLDDISASFFEALSEYQLCRAELDRELRDVCLFTLKTMIYSKYLTNSFTLNI